MDDLGFIDWKRAYFVGRGLVPPGPKLPSDEIAELVVSIKTAAAKATDHVREVSELNAPAETEVLVLSRAGWIKACALSGEVIMGSLGAKPAPSSRREQFFGASRGVQVGAALAAVSTRILGQFDPFTEPSKLLLVAPNVAEVERQLKVDSEDFRLWVCLHEQTHRFQFGHAPWLRGHVLSLMRALVKEEESVSWPKETKRGGSILEVVLTPGQRVHFDAVTAVMSLMEGHADVMMDRVGTAVVPTLAIIRKAFEARRDTRGWTNLIGKFIGTDLKLAQYREGAGFCRSVIEKVGVAGLNTAFTAPEALPTMAEIREPADWVSRVHG